MSSSGTDRDKVLNNIAKYEEQGRLASSNRMQVETADEGVLDAQLDDLIRRYAELLNAQRQTLDQLQGQTVPLSKITTPSTDPLQRLRQLEVIEQAYDSLAASKPALPDHKSSIAGLLAVKELNESIANNHEAVNSSLDQLESNQKRLRTEDADFADANQLSVTLQKRATLLERNEMDRVAQAPEDASRKLISAKIQHKKTFEAESQKLLEELVSFLDDHLGALIAAEELGGPVAGDLQDIGDDMLTAGFSSQGKPKSNNTKPVTDDQRQRRIDKIWGAKTSAGIVGSEHEAAGAEAKQLIEELLESSRVNASSYTDLQRESAASRFLVRAKVAQFHPKDARKLRLLDFGRNLYD